MTKFFWKEQERKVGLECPEWLRLGQLALTIVPGSVAAERLFSNVSFIKSKLRNRLEPEHLSACLRVYCQPWYTVGGSTPFPYDEIVTRWTEMKKWRLGEAGVALAEAQALAMRDALAGAPEAAAVTDAAVDLTADI